MLIRDFVDVIFLEYALYLTNLCDIKKYSQIFFATYKNTCDAYFKQQAF